MMSINQFPKLRQGGLTLLEIMLAMTLSVMLIMIVVQVYVGSKQTYRMVEALGHMQENGRFALELLTGELRMAGFEGCADPELVEPNIIANGSPTTDFYNTALRGFETGSSGWTSSAADLPSSLEASVVAGTDVIAVQYGDSIIDVSDDDGTVITTSANPGGIGVDDIVMIADCISADIFKVTAVNGNDFSHAASGNSSATLSKDYGANAELMVFASRTYYIGNTGRSNSAGDSVFALFRRDTDGTITEMIEGVENMQIVYGEQVGDNVRYVPASAVTDMTQVISVRIGLLMASYESVTEDRDTLKYTVAGTKIGPDTSISHASDRRLRRVYTTTINLRNRDF